MQWNEVQDMGVDLEIEVSFPISVRGGPAPLVDGGSPGIEIHMSYPRRAGVDTAPGRLA